ncbi:heme-degrading monooxygenase HmoA [Sphingomonas vulcanisoli]|uniref:Heme-degrading monooxygenase HmoA n=1 Tax=Sphingomonas vulcanisoli TaxID=1658060 RepID=A0ABX0TVG5_9SPHN|nr:antibiotic biosynthesis monooxygenase [Sphingomonas vulcanisoli]NIJ09519.1 heme-degrading monooxygenase HmoA [Sphingomonas vulcanisoli]
MDKTKRGACAVIFISRRNANDPQGYAQASETMAAEAARQPGYLGMDSVRDADGEGITISFWQDEAAALAWRKHAEHSLIRDRGRSDWYDRYGVVVTRIERAYHWRR